MKKLLFVVFATFLFSVAQFAQTPTGTLSGTVMSPEGSVVPGATVEITFKQTGKSLVDTSGNDGGYKFSQLEPGIYTVTVKAKGFKTFVANEVKIDIGREYTLPAPLAVGEVTEVVTVNAGADVITATSAQVTNTVSPQQILSLPLVTRDPISLTTLQAGVASNPFQNSSINGMRTTLTNITRDGISINDGFIRTNATDFAASRLSTDDTGEFTISTTNQEADLGSGGAQTIIVTPRGTKDFHGALFAYNRNSAFAANNFFNNRSGVARPYRNRNQYGGKISGPFPIPHFGEGGPYVERNKGFFFISYEGVRDPVTSIANRTILTPSARTGAFSFNRATAGTATTICPGTTAGSICTIPNLLTFAQSQGFAGIPSSIDPLSLARIINAMPATGNSTSFGDSLNTTGYTMNRSSSTTRKMFTNRFDVDATEKDAVNVIFTWNKENVDRPDVDTAGYTAKPDVTQYAKNKQFTIAYRRIFSSSIVNEIRWGIFTSEVPFKRVSSYPTFFLGPQGTTSGTLAGIISQPDNIFLDQGRNNKGFTLADNFNWVAGKHSLKFGFQFQKQHVDSYNDVLTVPNYIIGTTSVDAATNTTFSTTNFTAAGGISTTQLATANGLLAILGGLVNQRIQGFNTTSPTSGYQVARNLSPYRNENNALYAMDRWSAGHGLTISLGLRWEIYPALKLNNGLALEPVLANPSDPAGSLLSGNGTYNVIGTGSGKTYTYYKTDWNNFAPSVGVAWAPSFEKGIGRLLFGAAGRSVIRGGYSQVYGNDSIITSLSGTLSGNVGLGRASNSAIGPTGTTALNDRLTGSNTPILPPAFVSPPRTFLQNNTAGQGFFGVANAVDPKLQIPMTEQYSVGFQREFFGNTALEIRYVGTRSKNLTRGLNVNEIDVVNNGFLADFQRAQANLALTGTTAFCNPTTVTGCQALTLLRSGAIGTGPLVVGTTLSATTFNAQLRNGTVADLAQLFVSNNLNNHPTLAAPGNVPFVKFYQNPNIGQIELFTNSGWFQYNSLQLEVRRRFASGLYFQANYTFSKNLTDTVGTSQGLFEAYIQNNNPKLDNQRADFDQTHTFNFNGIYQLPFGKGKWLLNQGGVMDKIFGGWELSGLLQIGTGSPITFVDTRGTLNRGTFSGRQTAYSTLTNAQIRALSGVFEQNGRIYFINPSVINSPANGGTASNGYINPSNANTTFAGQVFFNVGAGQTGNMARTLINGPSTWNANAALLKNIRFTESMRVQLRMEAFNVFNNVNFFNNTQLANVNSSTFGQITSAGTSRQIQFAARFEF